MGHLITRWAQPMGLLKPKHAPETPLDLVEMQSLIHKVGVGPGTLRF